MFLLLLLLWIIFNGQLTLEIFIFGLIFATIFYAFLCKFFDFSIRKDIIIIKRTGYILEYLLVLFVEIVKANVTVVKLLFSARYDVEPAIVSFESSLKSEVARVILANSITLTPGTITVSIHDNELKVHCLDKSLAEGLNDSIFVKLLTRIESTVYKED